MKLLCINAGIIKIGNVDCCGTGLKEGEIYTTKGEPFYYKHGELEYYIDGLGPKLMRRFTKAIDQNIKSKKSIEEQIKKAIDDENYELAELLTYDKQH